MAELLPRNLVITDEILEDLRTVLTLPSEQFVSARDFLAEVSTMEDFGTENALRELRRRVAVPPEKAEAVAKQLLFLAVRIRSVSSRDLTPVAAKAAAGILGLEDEEATRFTDLLAKAFGRASEIEIASRRSSLTRSGNVRLVATAATCDLRPVFARKSGDDEEESMVRILSWDPVVQLELVGELNDVTTNHLFVLDSKGLDKLIDRLGNARKRLRVISKLSQHMPVPYEEEI